MGTNKTIGSVIIGLAFLVSCGKLSRNIQNDSNAGQALLYADDFLLADHTQTKVMLLGTWHFAYPNLDSHKVDSADMTDLGTPARQREILEVVNGLKQFKPTIICIESQNQHRVDSLYSSYLNGTYKLSLSEDEQLGFRLAKELGMKKIYATDAYSWLRESYRDFPSLDELWDSFFF